MKRIAIASFCLFIAQFSKSQGCSDAGFCSIGSFKTSSKTGNNTFKNAFTLGSSIGKGDGAVSIVSPYLQYDRLLSNNWQVQAKLTYNSASGNGFSASGLGDVFITGIKNWQYKNEGKLSLNAGFKVPLGSTDEKNNGQSLPLVYQPTLGTLDAVVGASYLIKGFNFSAGLQVPLSGNNNNSFFATAIPPFNSYSNTNKFNRKPDALLKATKDFTVGSGFTLNVGALAIYHIANDTYVDAGNKTVTINKSQGLTLNLTAGAEYKATKRLSFSLLAGKPFVSRSVRPDGLTRSWVVIPELKWKL
jgi:hypothetical protein